MALRSILAAERFRPGRGGFYVSALLLVAIGYALVLSLTTDSGSVKLVLDTLANITPIALGGLAVRALWRGPLSDRPTAQVIFAHGVLAALFAIFNFWLLMVLLGALSGDNPVVFSVRPFLGPAAAWQLMQGATFYAVIALAVQLENAHDRLASSFETGDEQGGRKVPASSRPFIKEGDDIRPLDPDRIIQISGADDYAEVRTVSGTHMLRTTLAELERSLGDGFLRVHRSHIVNVDRIARIEPAGGGRYSLHMAGGETVTASRAGAKAIRERLL